MQSKFVTSFRPLFPGYLFVALIIAEGRWSAVNSTTGITRLVSFGRYPASVPYDLVSNLMLRYDHEGKLQPTHEFRFGEEVMISKGPLTGFIATVEAIEPNKRVWVLLEIMGRETRVTVESQRLLIV